MSEYQQPEKDDGNVEYKLKLVDKSKHRLDQWVTQMRYRVNEGKGEAIYTLGISDDGCLIGLEPDEYASTKEIFDQIVKENNYLFTLISEKAISGTTKRVYEFLIRENNEDSYIDLKVAIAGGVDSGKSSTLGTLVSGKPDNGRGSARLNIFNFSHEIKSGRTSSMAQHIIGFDEKGQIVESEKRSWPEIIKESTKVVTFFDLCGHEKYLKTTIMGLTSMLPDLCIITIGSNMGVSKMTKEHLFLCMSLHIPFLVLITKVDICADRQNVLQETVAELKTILKDYFRRVPYKISSEDDVILTVKNFHARSIVPFIYTSNVTGEGMNYVKQFLNLVSRSPVDNTNKLTEFHIEHVFQVPGVGTVVGGQLISGTVSIGDKLLLGPLRDGTYENVQIKSIHCKRINVNSANAGCYVCIALRKIDKKLIKRGNVLISQNSEKLCVYEFEADISVMKSHSTTIKVGYAPVVHTCSVRQSACIMDIYQKSGKGLEEDSKTLRTGDKAIVKFKFVYKPEYIKAGMRILLAEGRVKIVGVVKSIN